MAPASHQTPERNSVELRLNLATCSMKDAEHAIFLIGAYFGMTNLPTVGDRNTTSVRVVVSDAPSAMSLGRPVDLPKPSNVDPVSMHTHSINDPGVSHTHGDPVD